MAEAATQTHTEQHDEKVSRVRSSYSRPVFMQELTLHSLQAQRVVDRSLSRVSYSLFSLDVILQVIGKRDQVDQVEEVVSGLINEGATTLDNGIAQLQARLKEHGYESLPQYTNPKQQTIEISSPNVAKFARLISKLDTVISLLDTLWLHGLVTSKQRTNAAQDWQQFLNKLASRIIGVEKQARIAAHREGKQDEVNQAAPETEEHDLDREAAALSESTVDEKAHEAEPAKTQAAASA
ncbi:hypothetical protein DFO67_11557 [Modicisalibacter xianhensis]|uniref:DUF1845 domain-containing protein n=1 Tax=Modicisalibacter xianhensis TaxID=442341 RepID=A0A4R8FN06_9GAMM|nr:hypothetical protein [Halomonas xianhensis]TDX26792.1 hypothetical protein DFO67_11557 [Halomonas xianhensis]